MINKVKSWLENPKRDYAEGLAIFTQYASSEIKEKYFVFFQLKNPDEKVGAFDIHFTMLINKVKFIYEAMKRHPEKFISQKDTEGDSGSLREEILKKARTIREMEDEKAELQAEIDQMKESEEFQRDEIDQIHSELEKKDSEINSLKEKMEEKLKFSGLKIVSYENLPKGIQEKFDRTKEIVPLIAKIHSDMSVGTITDEERKKLANELCSLDDERRSLWDEIDAWAEGKECVLEENKEIEYSEDPLIKGMQVSKRIERLKENIIRTGEAIKKHVKSGKKNMEVKSRERLTAYENELKELERLAE